MPETLEIGKAGESCNRVNCIGLAKWRVSLNFKAPAPYDTAPPVVAYLGIVICDGCKEKVAVHHFLSDTGWEQIRQGFIKTGSMVPDRKRTTLGFVELGTDEDRRVVSGFTRDS